MRSWRTDGGIATRDSGESGEDLDEWDEDLDEEESVTGSSYHPDRFDRRQVNRALALDRRPGQFDLVDQRSMPTMRSLDE